MVCVLVTGIPASGKSTLAAALSEELGLPWFSKDSIKELLFDTVGFRSREEKAALGVGSAEILYYCAGQALARGQSVILENNFENASKPGLLALLEKYRCPVVTVALTGNLEVIYKRFLARDASLQRHRGHVVNTCYPEPEGAKPPYVPITLERFAKSCHDRGMDTFTVGSPRIVVDATDPSKVDCRAIAEQIRSFCETA